MTMQRTQDTDAFILMEFSREMKDLNAQFKVTHDKAGVYGKLCATMKHAADRLAQNGHDADTIKDLLRAAYKEAS